MKKTYGTIKYSARRRAWEVECAPHVAIRLKRVFGKADDRQFGTIAISDTIENARDLEWFIERYPMSIKGGGAMLAQRASKHREREALVQELLSARSVPTDFNLALPPRNYQSVAAQMWRAAGGMLLADDVGLGKTVTAIAGFNHAGALPCLVVTLTHLPRQWAAEINRFAPGLSVHILKKGEPYDLTDGPGLFRKFPDVIISNYHKLHGWAETLAPLVRAIVFDECQELRRDGDGRELSKKYAAAQHIAGSCDYRLGLSATPIYNYGGEIYNVLNILCPGHLGTRQEFGREWCSGWVQNIENPKAFGVYARETGIILRRTRNEVGRELPEITIVPHHIDTDEAAFHAIQGRAVELARLIMKQGQAYAGEKMQAAGEIDYLLRQATGVAKAPFVAEFVRFLVKDNDEKVVLFGWHHAVYDIWKEKLADLNPAMYTGTESPTQKEAAKQAFLRGESKVLIISLRSGQGLDGLQNACNVCVFGELDWSPGVHEQCIGRVHRDGQQHPVTAYYLISNAGADPIICDVLGLKKKQIEGVRDPSQELVTKLQVKEDHIRLLAEKYLAQQGVTV